MTFNRYTQLETVWGFLYLVFIDDLFFHLNLNIWSIMKSHSPFSVRYIYIYIYIYVFSQYFCCTYSLFPLYIKLNPNMFTLCHQMNRLYRNSQTLCLTTMYVATFRYFTIVAELLIFFICLKLIYFANVRD